MGAEREAPGLGGIVDATLHSPIAPQATGDAAVDAAHLEMRQMDGAWRVARAAGQPGDVVRMLAELYVDAAHEYQRLRWGRVRCRVRVAALLR